MDPNEKDRPERSGSGAPIFYHEEKARPLEPVAGDSGIIEAVDGHIEKHIGKVHLVWHEIVSDVVHIDVHHVRPGPGRDFHTLITSGMSSRPMKVPDGCQGQEYAELVVLLPPEWKISKDDFKAEENYWPVRQLFRLARFPHEYDTWLGYGHTVPHTNPPTPYAAGTAFNTMLLMPPISLGEDFLFLPLSPEKRIAFFALIPLYQEEVDHKLKKGSAALLERFNQYQVSDVIDIRRSNTCLRKQGWF